MTSGAKLPGLVEADHLTPRIDALERNWRYAEAERLALRQLETRERLLGHEDLEVAESLDRLADILKSRGKFAEAEKRCRTALDIRRKLRGEEDVAVARSLDQLGNLRMARGDLTEAEPLILKALALRRAILGLDGPEVAASLRSLAWFRAEQGNWVEAESWMRESLATWRKTASGDDAEVARCLNALAYFVRVQRRYDEATSLLDRALAMRRRIFGPEHPEVAQTLHSIACFNRDRPERDYATSERYFRESLAIFRKFCPEDHPSVILNLANLGDLLKTEHKDAQAEPVIRRALELRREVYGEEHDYVRQSLEALSGLLLENRHDYLAAEVVLREMARIYEAVLARSGSAETPSTYRSSPYLRLAETQLLQGRGGDAWSTFEHYQGRILSDFLAGADRPALSRAESARRKSLHDRRDRLEHEVSSLRRRASSGNEAAVQDLEGTRTRLLAAESDLRAFEDERSALRRSRAAPVLSLERIHAAIPERGAILGWLDNTGLAWAYVIRKSGPVRWVRLHSREIEADPGPEEQRFNGFLKLLRGNAEASLGMTPEVLDRAQGIYEERIAPVESLLDGVDALIVVPSDFMWPVPIETLVDAKGVSVIDRYAVSYAQSATLYALFVERSREGKRRKPGPALVLGDPPFRDAHLVPLGGEEPIGSTGQLLPAEGATLDASTISRALAGDRTALASLPRLRASRSEVQAVASLHPGATVLLGPDASEESLLRLEASGALGTFKTIHLSTHAFADTASPDRSALVLSQMNLGGGVGGSDGLLTAREVAREWELDADLVTLSACETAYGQNEGGQGYIGLAYAFLEAGARSVLASLWEVNDRATALLMRRFYENWRGAYDDTRLGRTGVAMSKAEALREAKNWLRRYTDERGRHPYEHPHHWAGFELIGDPR